MEVGIVGLPNVGKSSLFNVLTAGHAASSNYPFTTIEPNVGVVSVPDPRLARLAGLFHPKKTIPAAIRFVDIAGLVQGASQGAGLGNQFLSHIREVDAIVQLVRLFKDENVVHTMGGVDPLRDIEVIETELMLADLQSVERQAEKMAGNARSGDKEAKAKLELLERIRAGLNGGKLARQCNVPLEDLKNFSLLTSKPILYVGNDTGEADPAAEPLLAKLAERAKNRQAGWLTLSVKLESELNEMSEAERKEFREGLGLKETGLEKFIRESYRLLDLITFLTAGPDEVRAWTVRKGASAVEAAGRIHSDIAKGFVRADIYSFADIDRWGSEKVLQEKGLTRSEGKDYRMQDGDVCYFHFRA